MPKLRVNAEVGANITPLERAFDKGKKSGAGFAKAMAGSLAAAFSVRAVTDAGKSLIEYGAAVDNTAKRLGIGTDALQEFTFAAEQTGQSIETVSDALKDLALNRGQALAGSAGKLGIFSQLGISEKELKELSLEDLFKRILGTVNTEGRAAADQIFVMNELMGESGTRLLPAIKDGFAEITAAAKGLGAVVKNDVIQNLSDLDKRFSEVKTRQRTALASVAVGLSDFADDYFSGIGQVIGEKPLSPIGLARSFAEGFRQNQLERAELESGKLDSSSTGSGSAPFIGPLEGPNKITGDLKLQDRLKKEIAKTEFQQLSTLGKRKKLEEELSSLQGLSSLGRSESTRLNALIESEGIKRQLLSLKEEPIEVFKALNTPEVDKLGRIGGSAGSASNPIRSLAEKQLSEMRGLRQDINGGIRIEGEI